MTTSNVSNATIKSYAAGYEMTNTVIDNTSGAVAAVGAGATEVATIGMSFFAGIRFAISERRGVKHIPTTSVDDAARHAAKIEELKRAIEIFNRGHEIEMPAPTPKTTNRKSART